VIGNLTFSKEGKLESPNATASLYAPPIPVQELIASVKKDYQQGVENLTRPYAEFGGEGLDPLSVNERDKKAFNSYEAPVSEDPDQNWRWQGIRPITRDKIVKIAGHFIAAMLFPSIFAQNEEDEEDRCNKLSCVSSVFYCCINAIYIVKLIHWAGYFSEIRH